MEPAGRLRLEEEGALGPLGPAWEILRPPVAWPSVSESEVYPRGRGTESLPGTLVAVAIARCIRTYTVDIVRVEVGGWFEIKVIGERMNVCEIRYVLLDVFLLFLDDEVVE